MSHTRATVLSIIALVAGVALLIYVLRNVAPYAAAGQLDPVALLLLLTGVFLLVGGAGVLAALALHRRWPALALFDTCGQHPHAPVAIAPHQSRLASAYGNLRSAAHLR